MDVFTGTCTEERIYGKDSISEQEYERQSGGWKCTGEERADCSHRGRRHNESYLVLTAGSVQEALDIVRSGGFDICLLDLMLPDGTGYEICDSIRKHSNVPVMCLTACDDEVNTVMALEQGADDYIAKPFRIRELIARMKAVLRRAAPEAAGSAVVRAGRNDVYLQTGKVYAGNEEVVLTALEYKLLLVFLNHRGQTLSRRQILDGLWDEAGNYVNDNTLSVYIKRLRKKLGDPEGNELIRTVRGTGYRMEP